VVSVAPSATSCSVLRGVLPAACVLETSKWTGLDPTSAVRPLRDSQVTVTVELSSTGVYITVLMRKTLFIIYWQCSQRNSHNFFTLKASWMTKYNITPALQQHALKTYCTM